MRPNVLKRDLLRFIRVRYSDTVAVTLVVARVGDIHWATPDREGGFLYYFADATTISIPDWQTESLKRDLRGSALHGAVHVEVAPRYVEVFCGAGMSREFGEEVWACYKAGDFDLKTNPSCAKKCFLVQNLDSARTSDPTKDIDDEKDSRVSEGMMTVEEVATSGILGKLRGAQHACEKGGEAMPTTIFDVDELARESIKIKRKNAALTDQDTDMDAESVKTGTAGSKMSGQIIVTEDRVRALKMQLADAQLALKKMAYEPSITEANLWAKIKAVAELLDVKKVRAACLEREHGTRVKKRQHLFAERRETS